MTTLVLLVMPESIVLILEWTNRREIVLADTTVFLAPLCPLPLMVLRGVGVHWVITAPAEPVLKSPVLLEAIAKTLGSKLPQANVLPDSTVLEVILSPN